MSINFILQAIRTIHYGDVDEDNLEMIYSFMSNLDNEELNRYFTESTVVSYENYLELCIEVIISLISIYEIQEKYERCDILLKKKKEALSIIKSKTKKYV